MSLRLLDDQKQALLAENVLIWRSAKSITFFSNQKMFPKAWLGVWSISLDPLQGEKYSSIRIQSCFHPRWSVFSCFPEEKKNNRKHADDELWTLVEQRASIQRTFLIFCLFLPSFLRLIGTGLGRLTACSYSLLHRLFSSIFSLLLSSFKMIFLLGTLCTECVTVVVIDERMEWEEERKRGRSFRLIIYPPQPVLRWSLPSLTIARCSIDRKIDGRSF